MTTTHDGRIDVDPFATPCTRERFDVIDDVLRERHAQDATWGVQDHPNGTGAMLPWGPGNRVAYLLEWSTYARKACQRAAAAGRVTWRHIFLEEALEAVCEDDPAKLRAELVQVAAVATAWVEAIDRAEQS